MRTLWTPAEGDASFASVSLLEHGEAWMSGDTWFAPITGQTLTAINGIKKTCSQKKWQDGSIEFVRASSHALTAPDNANLQLTGAFTIEGQFRRAAAAEQHTLLSRGSGSTGWEFGIGSDDKLFATCAATTYKSASTIAADAWKHLAWVRVVPFPLFVDAKGLHNWATYGTGSRSNEQAKGGTYSIKQLGGGGATSDDHNDYRFGNGDFTVEWWNYFHTSYVGGRDLIAKRTTGTYGAFTAYSGSTKPVFYATSTGTSWNLANGVAFAAGNPSLGQWYHYSISRQGTNIYLHQDGVLGATIGVGTSSLYANAAAFQIGGVGGEYASNVYTDSVRITKGVGRYGSSGFTPPTPPYPTDIIGDPYWDNVVSSCEFETYSSSNNFLFIEGALEAEFGDGEVFNQATTLNFGRDRASTNYFGGWMNDIRITKGVARYLGAFTPPTGRFPDMGNPPLRCAPSPGMVPLATKHYWHT